MRELTETKQKNIEYKRPRRSLCTRYVPEEFDLRWFLYVNHRRWTPNKNTNIPNNIFSQILTNSSIKILFVQRENGCSIQPYPERRYQLFPIETAFPMDRLPLNWISISFKSARIAFFISSTTHSMRPMLYASSRHHALWWWSLLHSLLNSTNWR